MVKTAVVTGIDSSAIAKAICVSLVESSYEVVATTEGTFVPGTDDRSRLETELGADAAITFEQVDFSSSQSVVSLVARLLSREYDVIVNCATILAMDSDGNLLNEGTNFDISEFNRVIQSNVTAVAALCLGLKDHIRSNGCVINVTSSAAQEGAFATISYNASKAAVESLTKSLANILGPSKGIRVNSIAPGWIPPSPDVAEAGVVAIANALTPSLSVGTPDDVVRAVHYLIDSPFQNGSVMSLDGGITSSYLPYLLEGLQLRGVAMDETIETLIALIGQAKSSMR